MELPAWEKIQSDKERRTLRLPVPGGWIYLILEKPKEEAETPQSTSVFVPDSAAR
ncbi:MAG: hypothetical protein K5Q68_10610 [Roseococcus sp.]|nr:hypothetical protein [Roseococcus sp.]